MAQLLLGALRQREVPSVDWLERTAESLAAGAGPAAAGPAFVGAARRLGRVPLVEMPLSIAGTDGSVELGAWSSDDAGRAVLLVALAEGSPDQLAGCLADLYYQGDSREKRAIIRTLALLPDPGRFVTIALDAGRTNETDLLAALALRNSYPARYYSQDDFNRMVMKAVFVELDVGDILGLEERSNIELARMALDYIDQQESASRHFPPDIWRLVGRFAPPSAIARMLGYLNHSIADHRAGAIVGLAACTDPRIRSFLLDRAEIEKDPRVADALSMAIDRPGSEVSA